MYVPKKIEVPIIFSPRATSQSLTTIGSVEAPVTNHDGPIVIEEIIENKQDEVSKEVARIEEKKCTKGSSMYHQPICCPRGLNKTQWRKLQHPWQSNRRGRCLPRKRVKASTLNTSKSLQKVKLLLLLPS